MPSRKTWEKSRPLALWMVEMQTLSVVMSK